MKPTELRIGNILDFEGMYSIIKEIDSQGVSVFINETKEDIWIDLSQSTPVPLTEEILLKCGFGKIQNIYQRHNQVLLEPTVNNSFIVKFWTISISRAEPIYHNNLTIKYLHQLQNLYFALTGEELEIKFI